MTRVAVGVIAHAEPERLIATCESLKAHTPAGAGTVLLLDGPDTPTVEALTRAELSGLPVSGTAEPLGTPACFNRLTGGCEADVYVLLESGCLVGPCWLDHLLGTLLADPSNGLAGPSTNLAWNEQGVFRGALGTAEDVAGKAREAACRFGTSSRTLEPLYSLADFCYAVRREVVATVGKADEGYGLGPCWEMDYNVRAARAGFRGLWVGASYVYRSPFTDRRRREEAARFEASKRRFQDTFCGARLRGDKADYRPHCRGDACPEFAPRGRAVATASDIVVIATAAVSGSPPSAPLVSGIMPTADRREMAIRAARRFLAQDYPSLELVVVDDGLDPVADALPDDPRVVYVRLEGRRTIGAKRNLACSRARGEVIVHWDDDDWYPPGRVRTQVAALLGRNADVCGTSRLDYADPARGLAYRYAYHGSGPVWVAGNTLAYRRSFWAGHPFADVQVGEDARFVWSADPRRVCDLADASLCVARLHPGNTAPKEVNGPYWQPVPAAPLVALFGDEGRPPPLPALPLVSCIMPTADRRPFVALALRYFDRQDWLSKELIIVDDGNDPVGDLVAGRDDVRYVRLRSRRTIGEKRNAACAEARGEYVAHWDDDDWYAPARLRHQLSPLVLGAAEVSGLENAYTLRLPAGEFWATRPELHRAMFVGDVHGGTIAYRRSLLDSGSKYPNVSIAEDAALILGFRRAGARLARLPNAGQFVYVRHGRNAWRFEPGRFLDASGWVPTDPPPGFTAEDLAAYRAASAS